MWNEQILVSERTDGKAKNHSGLRPRRGSESRDEVGPTVEIRPFPAMREGPEGSATGGVLDDRGEVDFEGSGGEIRRERDADRERAGVRRPMVFADLDVCIGDGRHTFAIGGEAIEVPVPRRSDVELEVAGVSGGTDEGFEAGGLPEVVATGGRGGEWREENGVEWTGEGEGEIDG